MNYKFALVTNYFTDNKNTARWNSRGINKILAEKHLPKCRNPFVPFLS